MHETSEEPDSERQPERCRLSNPRLATVLFLLIMSVVCWRAFVTRIPVYLFKPEAKFVSQPSLAVQPVRLYRRCGEAVSIATATKALEGIWSIDPELWPDSSEPLSEFWKAGAVDNRTYKSKVHRFQILIDLIIAHRHTQDPRFIDLGKHMIRAWVREHPRYEPFFIWPWALGPVYCRAIAMCAFTDYCDELGLASEDFKAFIADVLLEHGRFLALPEYYHPRHNHGILSDYGLLVTATHLDAGEVSDGWIRLATERLREQVKTTYSTNGIHLEDSPGYHLEITYVLRLIHDYMQAVGLTPPQELTDTLAKAEKAASSFVMPDGFLVPSGDVERNLVPPEMPLHTAPEGLLIYPEAGYAIMRSGLFAFLAAANNSPAHKHCDDLSLIIADEAGPIISDPGLLNYELNDPKRAFTISWAAHSTVTTKDTNGLQRSIAAGIESYGDSARYFFVQGKSIRSGGRTHQRSVLYDRGAELILIVDECRSPHCETWERRFQFDPLLSVEEQSPGVLLLDRNGKDGYKLVLWPDTADQRIAKAETQPLQGWISEAFRDLVPAPLSIEKLTGERAVFVAALVPERVDARISVPRDGRVQIESEAWAKSLTIRADHVEVTTTESPHEASQRLTETSRISLKHGTLRTPFVEAAKPFGFRRKAVYVSLMLAGWALAFGVLRTPTFRYSRLGTVLALLCAVVNVAALVTYWTQLG